jgi:hypothetical protein
LGLEVSTAAKGKLFLLVTAICTRTPLSLSVTITRGTYRKPFSSLRKNRLAAVPLRRLWTRMSRTFPSWSTADQLNITQTQTEAVMEPDGMLDDLGREAEATVRVRRHHHAAAATIRRQPPS